MENYNFGIDSAGVVSYIWRRWWRPVRDYILDRRIYGPSSGCAQNPFASVLFFWHRPPHQSTCLPRPNNRFRLLLVYVKRYEQQLSGFSDW